MRGVTASLEELTAWSLEELTAEVKARLPEGQELILGPNRVAIKGLDSILWEESGLDVRVLLYSAYAFLTGLPDPSDASPWVRRQPRNVVRRPLPDQSIPDPGDLDPEEIESVYFGRHSK